MIFRILAALCFLTFAAQAAPHGVPVPLTCPLGITGADDGCINANINGNSGTNANILTTINSGTPYLTTPSWNLPYRDYPVGYDKTLTLTPAASWSPPSNYSCSLSGHTWNCQDNAATCVAPCVISGVDFNDYRLIFNGSGGTKNFIVTNNHFKNGPDIALNNGCMLTTGSGNNFSITVTYNEFDGDDSQYGFICGLNLNNVGTSAGSPVSDTVEYNWFHDMPTRAMNGNLTNVIANLNYNYGVSLDMDSWTAQNVSIDSVANTMTVTGPFITTGPNNIHSGFNDCVRYPTGQYAGGNVGVTGTVGAQISGTTGGFGVYAFTGASGNLTNVTFACGLGLHGEFAAAGPSGNNSQANTENYIGDLIVFGNDCNPLTTADITFLNGDNIATKITSANVSYDTIINRISGNGTWGGCGAHGFANNATGSYGSFAYHDNYMDPTNESAGGSTQSSCVFNPGSWVFTGTQSGSTLTVATSNPASPLPIGAVLTQSAIQYGTVTDNSLANTDGTGTYTMSDSRTQSFASGSTDTAPNQGNAGGSIPYAPVYSNVFNMLLTPAAGANAITISDARMRTNAGCHT